jgi:hypothetical protein
MMFNTPIVLICFNRPIETKKVFNKIKFIKPKKLFLIMDGPKENSQKDNENCILVKNIVSQISWKCKVYKNFSKKNLGLKNRIVSGLNWVFSNTNSAIILEDDCLPSNDFFNFCEKILIRYKKNNSVKFITGNNFQKSKLNINADYYFSKYSHIWGWATWKSTWKLYCDDNKIWDKYLESKKFSKICPNVLERRYWRSMFDKVKNGSLKSWSIYLLFTLWKNDGWTVTPNVNLVKNLGFNNRGTNTKIGQIKYNKKTQNIGQNLKHPKEIFHNFFADNYVFENVYSQSIKKKITNLFYRIFND